MSTVMLWSGWFDKSSPEVWVELPTSWCPTTMPSMSYVVAESQNIQKRGMTYEDGTLPARPIPFLYLRVNLSCNSPKRGVGLKMDSRELLRKAQAQDTFLWTLVFLSPTFSCCNHVPCPQLRQMFGNLQIPQRVISAWVLQRKIVPC